MITKLATSTILALMLGVGAASASDSYYGSPAYGMSAPQTDRVIVRHVHSGADLSIGTPVVNRSAGGVPTRNYGAPDVQFAGPLQQ